MEVLACLPVCPSLSILACLFLQTAQIFSTPQKWDRAAMQERSVANISIHCTPHMEENPAQTQFLRTQKESKSQSPGWRLTQFLTVLPP